jgi:RecA-family ATPase
MKPTISTEAFKEDEPKVLLGRPLGSFNLPEANDPNVLIGKRWLSKGDIFILASTSGMGKSSLTIQASVTWGLGLPLFGGFMPHRKLKSLIIQSEDGDGDIAEVRLSLEHAMKLTDEQKITVDQNVIIVTDRVHRGLAFRAELKRLVEIHKPDIVWINPLLAFIGGDVNDSTDVGEFLREQLNSLNEPAQFAYGVVHHTAKPPKDRKERQWNEVMYEMAGSADLTNASRAVLALQATEKQGEFRLIAAKRGPRAGLITEAEVLQGLGACVICEGCGFIRVDHEGNRLPEKAE